MTELEKAQRYALKQERHAKNMARALRAIWNEAWRVEPLHTTDEWLNRVARAVREAKEALRLYEEDMADVG